MAELKATLEALQKEFDAMKGRDVKAELEAMRSNLVEAAVAQALKEVKSEEVRVSGLVEKTASSVLASVKKDLIAEVKKEVETMLVRRVNDQVAEAVFEHKGASSLLTWFDSGQGKTLNDQRMEAAVKNVLAKLYSERLGKVDWLLGINGAHIIDSTESNCNSGGLMDAAFCRVAPSFSAVQLSAASMLQGDVQSDTTWLETSSAMLGNCWAMKGSQGAITIGLKVPIRPSEFVVQHAPTAITVDGGKSAPQNFRIQGRLSALSASASAHAGSGSNDSTAAGAAGSWVLLVEGEYVLKDITADSSSLTPHMQSFPVAASGFVDAVKLQVLDNHGGETHTCLYHLRMYGDPQ